MSEIEKTDALPAVEKDDGLTPAEASDGLKKVESLLTSIKKIEGEKPLRPDQWETIYWKLYDQCKDEYYDCKIRSPKDLQDFSEGRFQPDARKTEDDDSDSARRYRSGLSPMEKDVAKKIAVIDDYGKSGKLFIDPALAEYEKTYALLPPGDTDIITGLDAETAKKNLAVIVCRNLYLKNEQPNPESVSKEIRIIEESRKEVSALPIFKNRNVVLLAHNEEKTNAKFEKTGYTFGSPELQDAIRKQSASLSFIRSQDERATKETKQKILDTLRTTKPPLTFFFDGHGFPDMILLDKYGMDQENGMERKAWKSWVSKNDRNGIISSDELADVFRERASTFKMTPDTPLSQRDILIFASCFGATAQREFINALGSTVAKPIVMSGAEYMQRDWSDDSAMGGKFADKILDLSNPEPATFGRIFENEGKVMNAVMKTNENAAPDDEKGKENVGNPTLYIPSKDNDLRQISSNTTDDDIPVA